MSWGALPWWVYEVKHEHDLALMSCAFNDEWLAGTSKLLPDHVIAISKATFKTWEPGGWNCYLLEET